MSNAYQACRRVSSTSLYIAFDVSLLCLSRFQCIAIAFSKLEITYRGRAFLVSCLCE